MNIPNVYSFVLSQLFGLYTLVMVMILINRKAFYLRMVGALSADNPVISVAASFSLLLGIFLVDTHNIWELKYRVGVTILCWAILLTSVCWLAFPERMLSLMKRIFSDKGYNWVVVVFALCSLILLGKGMLLVITNHLAWH